MVPDNKGFTSKEFIMVLVVIGILCLAAIPPFYALQNSRRRTDMEKFVATLRGSLAELHAKKVEAPGSLDDNPEQSACLNCFSAILPEGVNNPLWYKFSPTVYLYSANGNHGTPTDYQETGDFKLEYDPAGKKFELTEIRSDTQP